MSAYVCLKHLAIAAKVTKFRVQLFRVVKGHIKYRAKYSKYNFQMSMVCTVVDGHCSDWCKINCCACVSGNEWRRYSEGSVSSEAATRKHTATNDGVRLML